MTRSLAKKNAHSLDQKITVMVFGTFDIIHKGHIDFFRQARKVSKNCLLVVSIARDKNVIRIKKQKPHNSQNVRLQNIQNLPEVSRAILGGVSKYMPHIIKVAPDIIALGYDQIEYTKTLKKDLRDAGLSTKIVRLQPFKPHLYKTSLIKKKMTK